MAQSGRANRARRPPEVALAGVEWRETLSGVIPEAILEPGFAEALQRLFEARERREALLDLASARSHAPRGRPRLTTLPTCCKFHPRGFQGWGFFCPATISSRSPGSPR